MTTHALRQRMDANHIRDENVIVANRVTASDGVTEHRTHTGGTSCKYCTQIGFGKLRVKEYIILNITHPKILTLNSH